MGDFDTRKVLSRRHHHHRSKFLKQKGLMGFEQKIEREGGGRAGLEKVLDDVCVIVCMCHIFFTGYLTWAGKSQKHGLM